MMNEIPYISFVVTARNDDYGGNWINRINAFMKVLAYQADRTRTFCELVFVEYNPVENMKLLQEELSVPENKFLEVRFITVPKEFHKSLPDNEKVSVCEFIGKNIGIRRAKGEFICGTNPDVLFSDELFDFFAKKQLDKKYFYRVNRRDTPITRFGENDTTESMIELAKKKAIKVMYSNQTLYLSYREWFKDLIHGRTIGLLLRCPVFNHFKHIDNSKMHENAAGDFLLTHKDNWDAVGGYDERTVGSGVFDGYVLYLFYCLGLEQIILEQSIYHLYHHHKGVKYLASHKELSVKAREMLDTKIPYRQRDPLWGFASYEF